MTDSYPADYNIHPLERIQRAMDAWSDLSNLKAAVAFAKANSVYPGIRSRILDNCEAICDEDLEQTSPEFRDLRQCGIELYEIGGFCLMKLTADSIATDNDQFRRRTRKGNSYRVPQLCNAAWNMIGDWVA